jgi:hypothetical protein
MENVNFDYPVTDMRKRIARWASGATPLPSRYSLGGSCDDDSHRAFGVTVRYVSNRQCVLCNMAYKRENRRSKKERRDLSAMHLYEDRMEALGEEPDPLFSGEALGEEPDPLFSGASA